VATVDDVPALVALWGELRQVGARAERAINPVATPDIAERLTAAIHGDDCRIVLATAGGEPAGMAVYRAVQPDPLSDVRVLQMMHVVVGRAHRRRGVGHALVAAAADMADELRIEHVGVGVYPSLREASRFYARLGFAQVMVQRVAPAAALHRRCGTSDPASQREDVVRRRARVRRPMPAQRLTQLPERVEEPT
jgi:GNAT superfamily N-acetyltransferase